MIKSLVLFLALSSFANAEVVVEHADFLPLDFNGLFPSLVFKKFDPTLGALKSVDVQLEGDVFNTFTLSHASVSLNESLSVAGFFAIAPSTQVVNHNGALHLQASGAHATNPTDWIGAGTNQYAVIGFAESTAFFANGNGFADVTSKASASGTVTFEYQSVPEPSEMALCLMVLIIYGVAAAKLRKAL